MRVLENYKAHKAKIGTSDIADMPLRQIIAYAIGFIRRDIDGCVFVSEDWRLPALGASAVPLTSDFLNIVYSIDKNDLDKAIAIIRHSSNPSEAKEGLMKEFDLSEIQAQAIKEGMNTLQQSGIRKMLEGITTVEEVIRVTGRLA